MAVAAIGTDEKQEAASAWVLTPANHLLERKNLAAAHSILPGPFPTAVHVTNLLHRDEWLLNRACISYIENAQIQVEGGEKKEKVNNKQESEILFTQHDLEKQLKEWATQPAQEGDAPVQPDSFNSGLGDAARWIEWEGNEAKEGESVMGDVMLDHRTNDLLLAEIGALQRDDVVENRLAALKEKYEDGRRRQVGKSDKLQHFYLGPHVVFHVASLFQMKRLF